MLSNRRKKVILFAIELFVIQRRIVNRTLLKSRETIISFDHDEKKKRKKFKDKVMIVISARVSDVNSFEKY